MTKEDIKILFPLKLSITHDILNSEKNIGEYLLKQYFPIEIHEDIFWGLSIGNIKGCLIKTEKEVIYDNKKIIIPFYLDRNSITEPIDILFLLRKHTIN